jgi:hypothetical protein
MASVVDICNSALNQIGASNIISLTEDSKAARICNQRTHGIALFTALRLQLTAQRLLSNMPSSISCRQTRSVCAFWGFWIQTFFSASKVASC